MESLCHFVLTLVITFYHIYLNKLFNKYTLETFHIDETELYHNRLTSVKLTYHFQMTVKLRGAIIKNGITIASLIIFNVVSRVFWTMYTLQKHLGKFSWFQQKLNSWRRSLSYRNQSIDLHSKSMDCGFYMIETSVMKDLSNFTDLLRLRPSQSSVPTPLDETHLDVVRGLSNLEVFAPAHQKVELVGVMQLRPIRTNRSTSCWCQGPDSIWKNLD